MLRTNPVILQRVLEQLDQATADHVAWHDHVRQALAGRKPCNPDDLAPDGHLLCKLGRWYGVRALPELRDLPSFAMIGAEHEQQHRVAAALLRERMAARPITRAAIEEFEEATSRLSFALCFIRREVEDAMRSRDALTEAHSSWDMLRDLRECHALGRQPGRQCCIAIMELDDVSGLNAAHGYQAGAQAIVEAVRIVAESLRANDKVFRHDGNRFLIRLSGSDLSTGNAVVTRLREVINRKLAPVAADGAPIRITASFGVALLDPDVDVLESIERANQALTLAKAAGRNQIIRWDPSVTTGVRLRRIEVKDVSG